MKINTVAILGAGAVGGYFIYGLQEKLGENLWIVSEGSRKERLVAEGLYINGEKAELNIRTPEEAHGVDLLLVAVKYGALRESLDAIEKIVDEHTMVMSLMNGVDSEEIIAGRIGDRKILYSFMKISSERKENRIVFNPEITQGVFFGKVAKEGQEELQSAVIELLQDSKVNYNVCEDIIQTMWYKYALNISKNLPQAIINCGVGAYQTSEYVATVSDRLVDEVIAVAKAKGIDISDKSRSSRNYAGSLPTARFSTLQDIDAKRHTEVDMFAGTMVKMGKELGIPTPYNEMTWLLIKALEEKNDGLLP